MVKKDAEYKKRMKERKQKRQQSINYRSEAERRYETLNIIYQLKENNISSDYPAVKTLLQKLNEYVESGETIEFSIPFPELKKVIKGRLPIHKNEEAVVVLKQA